MITVGLVATLLCAHWGAPPAKAFQKGLDTPISFQAGPARLTAVLNDLGQRMGWKVKVHGSLDKAIVVVAVKDKPAKELLDRLSDGIGAKWSLQDGTLDVQLGSTETAGNAALQAQHAKVLAGYLKWWMASQKVDAPVSKDEAFHAMMMARTFYGGQARANRDELLCESFDIVSRNPQQRLTARVFNAVGPKLLAEALSKGAASLTMADLPAEAKSQVEAAFGMYRQELAIWASGLEELGRFSTADWMSKQAPEKLPPPSINGFRMNFKKGLMPVTFQLLSGSQVSFSTAEFLPHERAVSWEQEAKPFDRNAVVDAMVPFDSRAKALGMLFASKNKPLPYDGAVNNCLKELSNPVAIDPLAFSRAHLLPRACEAVKKNLVAYLDDVLVTQTMQEIQDDSIPASTALNQLHAIDEGVGVREEGSWVLSGPRRPQAYLLNQFDRSALAKVIPQFSRPKLLTFGDYFDLLSEIGGWRNYIMMLADTLHSGYWTMHSFWELEYVVESLTAAERLQATGAGLDLGKLSPWAFERVRNVAIRSIPLQGEAKETLIPLETLRQARLKIEVSEPVEGFLVRAFYKRGGSGDTVYPPRQYCQDGYYMFHPLKACKTSEEMLARFQGGWAWPSKKVTARIVIDVPGFQPINDRKADQYTADLNSAPKTGAQLSSWLVQYYGK